MDNSKAVEAVKLSPVEICGHEMTIRLKSPDWRKILDAELKLCSDKVGRKQIRLFLIRANPSFVIFSEN